MGAERIFRHQLVGDLPRKVRLDATLRVETGQFLTFEFRLSGQLRPLPSEIGLFGVRLGTDGDIFTRRHRHGPSNKASDACD